jgi:SSS family solute:Na+ symporter
MAQNFWTAIWAWSACFLVTIAISLLTRRDKSDAELKGLVYALTPRLEEPHRVWWRTTPGLGALILGMALALNIVFW